MPVSQAQKKATAKWDKENMTTLGCKVKKSRGGAIQSVCQRTGYNCKFPVKGFCFIINTRRKRRQKQHKEITALYGNTRRLLF